MTAWLRAHLRAVADALDQLIGRPAKALLAALGLGALYLLPALAGWGFANLELPRQQWARQHEVVLILDHAADSRAVAAIEQQLRRMALAEWRFVSREQAMHELQADLALAAAIDGLARNPLPDAFVVVPGDGDPDVLAALAHEARGWPGVRDVEVDTARALREARTWSLAGQFAWLAALAIGVAGLTGAAIITAWAIQRPPPALELAALLGATRGWLIRPQVWQGLLLGAGASLLALAGVFAAQTLLAPHVLAFAKPYLPGIRLLPPDPPLIALVIATGTVVAGLFAWLAARRRLPAA